MKPTPILFSLFGSDHFAKAMQPQLGYEMGSITLHQFPDDETVINIKSSVNDKNVIMIADLTHPNDKILPLLFAAETAKELGAKKIGLIAPYLVYMRQDKRFQPGDSITSHYFATLISNYFDGLMTIDPHLHRWHALNDIYSIPAIALHATKPIAAWIKANVPDALLIGPDAESAQWVSDIAQRIKAPFLVLEKQRKGDNLVEISIPQISLYQSHTPILVDDIISTAATLIKTVNHLKSLHMKPPICIGVHALFAGNAYEDLQQAGVKQIITCNTIAHASNAIDVTDLMIQAMDDLFKT
ncbi:phosphoribosylpyrophosphate synthetase [Legionella steelei]|uniref:Phosphoribosylpyrophosphate synthetase n=1 Tax=Legionella steelei TaxID=947033 RepID=A0A0W0ZS39_9GAMM|nr:ribose-phosphate pyrophosphokinase [Legionella steelei]KTD71774.1 phosphoribosylpyrophosphate synthetase [Legionella steelei]